MKKNILSHIFIFSLIALPSLVLAQNIGIKNPIEADSIGGIVTSVVRAVRLVAIPFIVLAIMYSGWKYIVAQGKPDKIKDANKILVYTLIGTLIVLSAELISALIGNTLR
jgi:Type IV secretion system pilin